MWAVLDKTRTTSENNKTLFHGYFIIVYFFRGACIKKNKGQAQILE